MRRHGLCAALVLCFSLAVSFPTGNPPSFTTPLADVVVAAQDASGNNQGFSLICDAAGDDLTYAWHRNGLLLDGQVGRNLVVAAPIEDAEASLNGVRYFCVVSNIMFGSISSRTATVRLANFPTDSWETAATPIPIDTYTDGIAADDIWRVYIPCNPPVSAVPTPTVKWERAPNPPGSAFESITTASASDQSSSSRYILAPNGGLVIDQPLAADLAFTYRCVVTNAFTHSSSASGQTYTLQQNNELPASLDSSIHVYLHNSTLEAEKGTTVVVLNVIAPAAGGEPIFQVTFTARESLTPGASFSNNYVINNIQDGGTARALVISELNDEVETIGVLDTAVTVFDPANVVATSGLHRVLTGRSETLNCTVEAIPAATVDWYKDGVFLSSGPSATYTIIDAQLSNSGMYQCFASNDRGDSVGSISVQVRAPQLTLSEPLDRETAFVQGDNVTLAVTIRSDLPPNFKWSVRGQELLASDNNETYTVGVRGTGDQDALGRFAYNTTLRIQSINTTYEGQFSVEAVDGGGLRATTSGYVLQEREGQQRPTAAENAAVVHQTVAEVAVAILATGLTTAVSVDYLNQPCLLLGQNVTLRCVQDGVPRPSVSWSTGNVVIQPSDSNYRIEEGDELTLTIFNVVAEDDGEYECTAQNMLRDGTTSDVVAGELIISQACEPPQSSQSASRASSSSANFGEAATLSCEVSGVPLPTVTWLHRGVAVASTDRVQVRQEGLGSSGFEAVSTLTITSVTESDGGEYTCLAENVASSSTTTFSLQYGGQTVWAWIAIVLVALVCFLLCFGIAVLLICCAYWRHQTVRNKTTTSDVDSEYCITPIQQPPNHNPMHVLPNDSEQQLEPVYEDPDVVMVTNPAYADCSRLNTTQPNASSNPDEVAFTDGKPSTDDYLPMVLTNNDSEEQLEPAYEDADVPTGTDLACPDNGDLGEVRPAAGCFSGPGSSGPCSLGLMASISLQTTIPRSSLYTMS